MLKKKVSKVAAKPAVKKAVAKKPTAKLADKTGVKKTDVKPVVKKAVTKPAVKPAVKPVAKKTAVKTVAKPAVKKTEPKKSSQPVKAAPKKAVAKVAVKKSIEPTKKTGIKPLKKDSAVKPEVKEKKKSKAVLEKATTKKVATKKSKDDPTVKVIIFTSHGDIELNLSQDKAPITVINFLKYVKNNHYNGLIFHRVISGFMIQGGGYDSDLLMKDTTSPIRIESDNGLKNERGTIAMARSAEPNSATSQFYINLVDNPGLDYKSPDFYGYAVFGKVTKGLDIVDKIGSLPTNQRMQHQNIPIEHVIIKSVKVV